MYHVLNEYIDGLDEAQWKAIAASELREVFRTEHTIFGHALEKPFGYAGDYLLIEKIYNHHISHDRFECWDRYCHSHAATQAVRNRKSYFVQKMKDLNRTVDQPFRVLILGSGPATDVYEYLTETRAGNVHFDLLDIDQRAIDFAAEKNLVFRDQVLFIKSNVLRFSTSETYDLVWSAGLFDYLDDRQFSFLVRRLYHNLRPGGRMIIGNFSLENPTANSWKLSRNGI